MHEMARTDGTTRTAAAQPALPQRYFELSAEALAEGVGRRKAEFGEGLCILGHHYQRDEIIRFADFTGDSLKLSQLAASQTKARIIVFCGVHFMAESADVLSAEDQIVCLPHMHAGCSMAEMADADAVAAALDELSQMCGQSGPADQRIIPVTYVNSSAAIKAVTARAGGACCTSSNVRNVFEWALKPKAGGGAGGERILAIPDQHLGRNTAFAMGYRPADVVVYDPAEPNGGLTAGQVAAAAFILWKGHCYVHQRFTPQHIQDIRQRQPGVTVIVHPECPHEVVRLADASGSTEQIIRAVAEGRPGSSWAVGTESNLVNRLARRHTEMSIRVVSDAPALCVHMARIDLPHLLWLLDNLAAGSMVNRVSVPAEVAEDARLALRRMIEIKAGQNVVWGGR